VSGDISLTITLLTFPLTLFSLYYKCEDRRGLRPLLFYIPGGLMMCQYVILTSISEHVEAQLYLKDAVRLYNFTFYLQIIGIFVTIVANLWNASADVTIMNWLKSKGWFDRQPDEGICEFYCSCCCKKPNEAEADADADADGPNTTLGVRTESQAADTISMPKFSTTEKKTNPFKTAKNRDA